MISFYYWLIYSPWSQCGLGAKSTWFSSQPVTHSCWQQWYRTSLPKKQRWEVGPWWGHQSNSPRQVLYATKSFHYFMSLESGTFSQCAWINIKWYIIRRIVSSNPHSQPFILKGWPRATPSRQVQFRVMEPGSSIPIFYTVLFHLRSFYAGSLQTCRAAAERNSESLLANMTHICSLLTNMTHAKTGH